MRYDRIGVSAGARLERALAAHLGDNAVIVAQREHPWASATFTGHRHAITIRLADTDAAVRAALFAERCDTIEFAMPQMVVADMIVMATRQSGDNAVEIDVEALTIDD